MSSQTPAVSLHSSQPETCICTRTLRASMSREAAASNDNPVLIVQQYAFIFTKCYFYTSFCVGTYIQSHRQRNVGENVSTINLKGSHETCSFLYFIFFCKQTFEKEEVPIFLNEVVCRKLISSAHQPGKK